jgi:MFS family permease
VVGLLLGIAPLLVFAWKPAGLSLHEVAILLALSGCGLGTLYPVTTIVIQNVVPPHQLGTATGTLNFFRLLGGAIIVAVFGAIVVNALGAPAGAVALERMPSGMGAGAEMAAAFRWVFIAAVGFLLAALVSVLLTPERPLQGPSTEVRIAE